MGAAHGQESYQTIWKLTTIVKARTNEWTASALISRMDNSTTTGYKSYGNDHGRQSARRTRR